MNIEEKKFKFQNFWSGTNQSKKNIKRQLKIFINNNNKQAFTNLQMLI